MFENDVSGKGVVIRTGDWESVRTCTGHVDIWRSASRTMRSCRVHLRPIEQFQLSLLNLVLIAISINVKK